MLEWAKGHPYVVAGGLLATVAVIYIVSSGPSQTVTADDQSGVNGADQIQAMMAQVNGQIQIAGIQAQAHGDEIAGQKYLADLEAQTQQNANQLATQLGLAKIAAEATTTQQANTLSAQVSNNTLANTTEQIRISTAAQVENTRIVANALVAQAAASKPNCTSAFFGLYQSCK